MSVSNDKDGEHRPKSDHSEAKPAPASRPEKPAPLRKRPHVPEVGSALRTVYQKTIDEAIPPEMLDLLGKLG